MQIFQHGQLGEVRVVTSETGEPLFCLADVCAILDLRQSGVSQRLDKGVISNYPLQTPGGVQQVNFVNEDGLYDTILDSRKPEAEQFRKWVTSEVLPSIRKHGAYMTPEMIEKVLADPDLHIRLATGMKEERAKRLLLEQKTEVLALTETKNHLNLT